MQNIKNFWHVDPSALRMNGQADEQTDRQMDEFIRPFRLKLWVQKPDWNINSVNPLYLIINRVYGMVVEKNGSKYLSTDKGDAVLNKYDQMFSEIKYHIKKISDEEVNYNAEYEKIKFLTDDSLPLGK